MGRIKYGTTLEEYRQLAIEIDLNPTEIWRNDTDMDTEGFSFILNYAGRRLVYDVIRYGDFNDELEMSTTDYIRVIPLNGDDKDSFFRQIIDLAR